MPEVNRLYSTQLAERSKDYRLYASFKDAPPGIMPLKGVSTGKKVDVPDPHDPKKTVQVDEVAVTLRLGEFLCRAEMESYAHDPYNPDVRRKITRICGKRENQRNNLYAHIASAHKHFKIRKGKGGKPSRQDLQAAEAFFKEIMKDVRATPDLRVPGDVTSLIPDEELERSANATNPTSTAAETGAPAKTFLLQRDQSGQIDLDAMKQLVKAANGEWPCTACASAAPSTKGKGKKPKGCIFDDSCENRQDSWSTEEREEWLTAQNTQVAQVTAENGTDDSLSVQFIVARGVPRGANVLPPVVDEDVIWQAEQFTGRVRKRTRAATKGSKKAAGGGGGKRRKLDDGDSLDAEERDAEYEGEEEGVNPDEDEDDGCDEGLVMDDNDTETDDLGDPQHGHGKAWTLRARNQSNMVDPVDFDDDEADEDFMPETEQQQTPAEYNHTDQAPSSPLSEIDESKESEYEEIFKKHGLNP